MGNRDLKPQTASQIIPLRVAVLVLFLCSLWGGIAPAIKIALMGIPPLGIAGMRFLLAWIAITLWCCVQKIALLPRKREYLPLSIVGLLFTTQIAALNIGAQWTSGSHVTVFLSTHPLFVALLSHFFLKGDRLTIPRTLGLILAFLGICVIFSDRWGASTDGHLRGDLTILLSGLLLGCIMVYTKYLVETIDLYKILVGEMSLGVPLFFLLSGLTEGSGYHFTLPVVLALVYQGVCVGGFAFVAWTHLLKRYPASRLTSFSFSTPIFGIVLSALLLSEAISLRLALGTGLVGTGIYLSQRAFGKAGDA